MKKLLFFLVILLMSMKTYSQINLEHTYDSASTVSNGSELMIINFAVSGEQYVKIDQKGKNISIYNLNHSLVKNISFAGFPSDINSGIQEFFIYLRTYLALILK